MDKDLLLKPRLAEEDVPIPGVGTVRVRALSRGEVMAARKATDDNPDGPRLLTLERKMLALAMVDPKLTESEVGEWQKAAGAGELDIVTEVVQRLSGLDKGADKSGVPGAGAKP